MPSRPELVADAAEAAAADEDAAAEEEDDAAAAAAGREVLRLRLEDASPDSALRPRLLDMLARGMRTRTAAAQKMRQREADLRERKCRERSECASHVACTERLHIRLRVSALHRSSPRLAPALCRPTASAAAHRSAAEARQSRAQQARERGMARRRLRVA